MAELTTVSDPTDWKNTTLQSLEHLDAALRCEVCKEFYNAPVITNCCHTFCSLCIRRALHADGRCPVCRAQGQECHLRKNTTVQDLLDAFAGCRQHLLEFAARAKVPERVEEREVEAEDGDVVMSSQRSWRSQQDQPQSQPQRPKRTVVKCSDENDDDYIDRPSPPPEDGLVPCPICAKRMKEALINTHLDRCLADEKKKPTPTPTLTSPQTMASDSRQLSTTIARSSVATEVVENPLARLTYNMMSERALRQKLRELSIPDTGSRKLLQERHTEWINLFNANLDMPPQHRRSKRELLRELSIWEKAHTRPANNRSRAPEWSAKDHSMKHNDEFQALIEQARGSVKRQKVEKEEAKEKQEIGVGGDDNPPPAKSVEKDPSLESLDWTATDAWPLVINTRADRHNVQPLAIPDSQLLSQPSRPHSAVSPEYNRYPASQPPAIDSADPLQPMLRPWDPSSTPQLHLPHFHSTFPAYARPPPVECSPPPQLPPSSSSQPTEGKRRYSSIEESTLTGTA